MPALILFVGVLNLVTLLVMTKAITSYAEKQQHFFDQVNASIDGIRVDVKSLADKIAELQNSEGEISAEDQALLDQLEQQADDLAAKIKAVDDMTPPTETAPGTNPVTQNLSR